MIVRRLMPAVLPALMMTVVIGTMTTTAAVAAPAEAPWTDAMVESLVKRDAKGFADQVIAQMPEGYVKTREQVAAGVPGFKALMDGLQPEAFDPAYDMSITASVICRSYFVRGQAPFSLIFHMYRPRDSWQLLSFNLQQLNPQEHAAYVRRACEPLPRPKQQGK